MNEVVLRGRPLSAPQEMILLAEIIRRLGVAAHALLSDALGSVGPQIDVTAIEGSPGTYAITLDLNAPKWHQLDPTLIHGAVASHYRARDRQSEQDVHGRLVAYTVVVNIDDLRQEHLRDHAYWVRDITSAFRNDTDLGLPSGCVVASRSVGERTEPGLRFDIPYGIEAAALADYLSAEDFAVELVRHEHDNKLFVAVPELGE